MYITLDSEIKNYKARVYGIIDAIGTLGGAFEIIFWIIMLFYGSIRKNLYLYSVVNSLSQDDESEVNQQQHNNDLRRSRRNQNTRKKESVSSRNMLYTKSRNTNGVKRDIVFK